MSALCDRCGNETDVKKQGVGDRGPWTMYICQSGCESNRINPKTGAPYAYGFFPKKKVPLSKLLQPSSPKQDANAQLASPDAVIFLSRIAVALERIAMLMGDPLEKLAAKEQKKEALEAPKKKSLATQVAEREKELEEEQAELDAEREDGDDEELPF